MYEFMNTSCESIQENIRGSIKENGREKEVEILNVHRIASMVSGNLVKHVKQMNYRLV